MTGENLGGHWIIRPGAQAEVLLRVRSEQHLRSTYMPGRYEGALAVNAIAQHQYNFFADVLSTLLPRVASRDFLQFVLDQYDQAAAIEASSRRGRLTRQEQARWDEIGPTFRRVVKFLAERTSMLTPPPGPAASKAELELLADQIWSCAEQMVDYAMMSEATHSVFPDRAVLTILPPASENYLEQEFTDVDFQDEITRMQRDLASRARFLPQADSIFHDIERHDRVLGRAMKETLGVSYKEAVALVALVIKGSRPPPDGFPVPFVHKETVVQRLAETQRMRAEIVRRVLAGFTVRPEDMWQERREVWNPKQEYRALRRGFFEFPHETGMHLAFSKEMAKEAFAALVRGATFGQFPSEWRSSQVNAALSRLGNEAGSWFEKQARDNVNRLGFYSVINAKQSIGTGGNRLRIPAEIGELDFLGYSPRERLLVIVECKFVQDSTEPRTYRDDIVAFATGKKAYADRFRRKYAWIRQNWREVCDAMETVINAPCKIEPSRVAGGIITFFPTIAARFIKDFPCVSLPEFMLDYEHVGRWPYANGIETL